MPGLRGYPTPWQRKMLWTTLTAIALAALAALVIWIIWLASELISFLQPLLIPFAIAGVLAFLLEPLVARMCKRGIPRLWAVIILFAGFLLLAAGTLAYMVPVAKEQISGLVQKAPEYKRRLVDWGNKAMDYYTANVAPTPATPFGEWEQAPQTTDIKSLVQAQMPAIEEQIPGLLSKLWSFIWRSVAGSLGIFGFLLGLVIVPVYLFLLLLDGPTIKKRWSDYLPLKASALKTELVSVLTEINGYLIAFFRGQLLVSVIDGVLTGIALVIIGLDFGLMIGLLLAVIGIIPYIGIVICWVPAVLIAFAQSGGDWHYAMWVTLVFIVVQQLDGIFIAPKIVGESVGLHPLTVIMSVFGWSLLLGGLLGAILAVPLTATLKVLLRRYAWDKVPQESEPILEPSPPGDPPATAAAS